LSDQSIKVARVQPPDGPDLARATPSPLGDVLERDLAAEEHGAALEIVLCIEGPAAVAYCPEALLWPPPHCALAAPDAKDLASLEVGHSVQFDLAFVHLVDVVTATVPPVVLHAVGGRDNAEGQGGGAEACEEYLFSIIHFTRNVSRLFVLLGTLPLCIFLPLGESQSPLHLW
jgi:hypothetical protein